MEAGLTLPRIPLFRGSRPVEVGLRGARQKRISATNGASPSLALNEENREKNRSRLLRNAARAQPSSDSEMAAQAVEVAQNGLGNNRLTCAAVGRRRGCVMGLREDGACPHHGRRGARPLMAVDGLRVAFQA
jgi:hypothetical protein